MRSFPIRKRRSSSRPTVTRLPLPWRRFVPEVRLLEDRVTPATVTWDGGGNDFLWSNALNWSGDALPDASDDVVIDFDANDFTVSIGPGSYSVASLKSEAGIAISGTLSLSADSKIAGPMNLSGTVITGSDLLVTGPISTFGGTLQGVAGQGRLIASGGGTLAGLSLRDGIQFTNPEGQTAAWSGAINLSGASTFENAGTLLLVNDSSMHAVDTGSTFHNTATGTLIKTGGDTGQNNYGGIGSSFFSIRTINDGLIQVNVGTIGFGFHSTVFENNGSLIARAAAGEPKTTVWLLNATSRSDGSIDADRVRFVGGGNDQVIAVTGSYNADVTEVTFVKAALSGDILGLGAEVDVNGVLDLTGATFAPGAEVLTSLHLNNKLITGEDLSVTGSFTIFGSALQGVGGQGSLTLYVDTTFDSVFYISDFHLINAGNAIWTAGSVEFYGDSAFTNAAGASLEIRTDNIFGSFDGHCMPFYNDGLLLKTADSGITDLHAILYNAGEVRVESGQIRLSCGYVQSGPGVPPDNGFIFPPGEDDGVRELPDNQIVVTSSYRQLMTGALVVQIKGHTPPDEFGIPGTDYGQIVVHGDVELAGSLQVQLRDGFVPAIGSKFRIIDNQGNTPIQGQFQGLGEGDSLWVGIYEFRISYQGGDGNNDVVLTFAGAMPSILSGRVFDDRDNNGTFDGADTGLGNVTVRLFRGEVQVDMTMTDADGYYSFTVPYDTASYRLVANQLTGYLDGKETAGSFGGTVDNTIDSNAIGSISLTAGAEGTGYDFANLRPSRLLGLVWEDADNDGEVDFGEQALLGVTVTLTGIDDRGNTVEHVLQTDSQGIYEFIDLRPGTYSLAETQPDGLVDGTDSLGTVNGTPTGDASVNDVFSGIVLTPGADGVNYNFGELRPAGTPIGTGQTAGIGFWQNKHGQALIKSLNGGPNSTQLANWLATTFPNMYGASAGAANLTGMTNAQVAAVYVSLFKRNGNNSPGGPPKLDAQVMATALAVYVTNESLAGTVATAYGFEVTATGVGTATFDVGANGAAFGVANETRMSVIDLLRATDERTRNGLLYDFDGSGTISNAERTLRTMANDVFSAINEAGGI